MKSLAVAVAALSLILLFWAIVLLAVITGHTPHGLGMLETGGEIIKVLAGACTTAIAALALSTWKRQSHAKNKIDFLDALTDAIHEFVDAMGRPVEMVRYFQFAVDAHGPEGAQDEIRARAAIAYIERNIVNDRKMLSDSLDRCAAPLAKIRSLEAKGQIFGFANYHVCQHACRMLGQQHDRVVTLYYVMGRTAANWQNPKTKKILNRVLDLDADDLKKAIQDENRAFLNFASETYRQIFK